MGLMSKALANAERSREDRIIAEAAVQRVAAEAEPVSQKKKR